MALANTEELKDGSKATAPYCFFRGTMLRHLVRFSEAEVSLREGLFLETEPHSRALALNTLATVLMDQGRPVEAIEFYENASRAWPDRGASRRGIAEVWLRQGREFPTALREAQQAVAIDKRVIAPSQEAKTLLRHRLGEDLAVLAWALAANAAGVSTVEFLIREALRLCNDSPKSTLAQVHYHTGQAYLALQNEEEGREYFRQAAKIDPQGLFGAMARSTITKLSM